MDNGSILIIVGVIIIVVIARKWDAFKWILGAGLTILLIVTAFQLGMFDALLNKVDVPSVEFK